MDATLPVRLWVVWPLLILTGSASVLLLSFSGGSQVGGGDVAKPTMIFPGDTWVRAEPEAMGVDSRKLEKAIAWFEKHAPSEGADELVIVRHGRVIWAGEQADRAHGTWSLTKVFSCMLLGVLSDEGLCRPETRVAEILPEMEDAYPDVTLAHLVTMRSGYEAEGDWPPDNLRNRNGGGTTPFTPSPESQFAPGTHFSYWDSAMNLFGMALTQLTGESLESLFQNRIAEPIGLAPDRWSWRKFSEWNGITVNGGSGNKGKHVEISSIEVARLGHLMLNRGRWNDQEVVSEGFVEAATSVQVPAELPVGGPLADRYGVDFFLDGRGVYGYNWWVNGVRPDGEKMWPGVPDGVFGAIGFNNNRMFVIPEWDMVVVRLGQDGREKQLWREEFAEFLERIGRAIDD